MRTSKINGFIGNFESSFLSCEKDIETIVKRLFVDSNPYSEDLKRLILINTPDCLYDKTNQCYLQRLSEYTPAKMKKDGYIRLTPKLEFGENEETKSYIIISFDNFAPNNTNSFYRDCTVMIDIICHPDCWEMDNYELRPLKIAGYIDGILNGSKLSGIGTLQFMGANEINLSKDICGYCLMYSAVHGTDDAIPVEEDD